MHRRGIFREAVAESTNPNVIDIVDTLHIAYSHRNESSLFFVDRMVSLEIRNKSTVYLKIRDLSIAYGIETMDLPEARQWSETHLTRRTARSRARDNP